MTYYDMPTILLTASTRQCLGVAKQWVCNELSRAEYVYVLSCHRHSRSKLFTRYGINTGCSVLGCHSHYILRAITTEIMEITSRQEAYEKIENVLRRDPLDVVANAFKLSITVEDLFALCEPKWVNDNIINFYLQLICERNRKKQVANEPSFLKVAAVSTFFYHKLDSSGFPGVKRWTRQTNLFDQDLLLVPVHLGVHWCLAAVDIVNKCVSYYDSMHYRNESCLHLLREFLAQESLDKRHEELQISEWQFKCIGDSPMQQNGSDCGVFTCITAEYLSRKASLDFTQADMPYFRKRMMLEKLVC